MKNKRLPALLCKALPLILAGGMMTAAPVQACPAEPYVGSICVVPYTRGCPYGFVPADGRQLQINQYSALYALIGATFGGNGSTYFNVPNLNGRTPVGLGTAPGGTPVTLGQTRGAETVTLAAGQLPAHNHPATFTPTIGPQQVTIPAQAGSGSITATAATDVVPGSTAVDPAPNVNNYHLTGVTGSSAGPVTTATPGTDKSTLIGTRVTVDASTYRSPVDAHTTSINVVNGGAVAIGANTPSGNPVATLPPQLGLYHCIATTGIFPSFD
jgi:microcystin-dependent protein